MPMSPRLLRPIASRLALPADADARAYVLAVNAADGQPLEKPVVDAIGAFVTGCKADGIWDAIKASCILAGARTLAGALVPLKGSAPTNNGPFVTGDYNRETGLVGNGSTKYLDSNRNNNADPQNDKHLSFFMTALPVVATFPPFVGSGTQSGGSQIGDVSGDFVARVNSGTGFTLSIPVSLGFAGVNRANSSDVNFRANGTNGTVANASATRADSAQRVFSRVSPEAFSDARIAFYSIGESLNLALLDTRVSALITAIGAAI